MSSVTPGAESDSMRIDKLEKELATLAKRHRYFAMFGITFMMLAVIVFGGRALAIYQNRVLTESNEIVLRDRSGAARAHLAVDDDAVRFRMFDPKGKGRVVMTVTNEGVAAIGICGDNEKARVALGMSEDQSTVFLNDTNGKARIGMIIDKEGPTIGIGDENGKDRAKIVMVKDAAGLLIFDGSGKRRAELAVDKESAGFISTTPTRRSDSCCSPTRTHPSFDSRTQATRTALS